MIEGGLVYKKSTLFSFKFFSVLHELVKKSCEKFEIGPIINPYPYPHSRKITV